MTFLTDVEIAKHCINYEWYQYSGDIEYIDRPMIKDFVPHKVRKVDGKDVVSYGLSQAGYDIRLGTTFVRYNDSAVISPLGGIDLNNLDVFESEEPVIMYPRSFLLSQSMEWFDMPSDVIGLAMDKSSYARCGLITNFTPLEPSWSGILTLEIHNPTDNPIVIYPKHGIVQIIFEKLNQHVRTPYEGAYQNQRGVTLSGGHSIVTLK